MKPIPTQARFENGQILYFLHGHRIDFSVSEFEELIIGIRDFGLFTYLEKERPGLVMALTDILKQQFIGEDWDEIKEEAEYILEQSIFDAGEILQI